MDKKMLEQISTILKNPCPHCGAESAEFEAKGIQYCFGGGIELEGTSIDETTENCEVTVDLSGPDTYSIDPVFIQCFCCKSVLLDRRREVALSILGMEPLDMPSRSIPQLTASIVTLFPFKKKVSNE